MIAAKASGGPAASVRASALRRRALVVRHAIGETEAQRERGVDARAEQQVLQRAPDPDQARQPKAASAVRHQTDGHELFLQVCVRREHAQIAGQGQIGSEAHRRAAHGRDERLRRVHDGADQRVKLRDARSEIRARVEIAERALQICTRAEGITGAGEHDRAHARVGRDLREARGQRRAGARDRAHSSSADDS